MTLSEQAYESTVKSVFNNILENVENQCDSVDIDIDDQSLTIENDDGQQLLLNKHAPTKEIWLSSPLSGAWHFTYHEQSSKWISSKESHELFVFLTKEISQLTQTKITL